MACTIDPDLIHKTILFHGHNCPGLAIGIRVSELARNELNIHHLSSPVCVVETDMCAVDAIQFLTGCTFGKGNLIHRDYGKSGFTFYDRNEQKGFRALFKESFRQHQPAHQDMRHLMQKIANKAAAPEEENQFQKLRLESIQRIMTAALESLFTVKPLSEAPVRPARILESLNCHGCNEMTMETRTRRFDGHTYCIPCFLKLEQKI